MEQSKAMEYEIYNKLYISYTRVIKIRSVDVTLCGQQTPQARSKSYCNIILQHVCRNKHVMAW